MIIGSNFIWAHMGKTGGDATAKYFSYVRDLLQLHIDFPSQREKHRGFPDSCEGKACYLNIRRLPSWYLSFSHHIARFGLAPEYRPLPYPTRAELLDPEISFLTNSSLATYPDQTLLRYTKNGAVKISGWFRMEYLLADILAFLEKQILIPDTLRKALLDCPHVNRGNYNHNWWEEYSETEIRLMYENNPTWASVEREAYGSLPFTA